MCECREKINKKLAEKNARIAGGFMLGGSTMTVTPPMIETEKLVPRGKRPPIVLATYCPFCGEKFKD